MSLPTFKQSVYDASVASLVAIRQQQLILPPITSVPVIGPNNSSDNDEYAVATTSSAPHILLSLTLSFCKRCHLCRLRRIKYNARGCKTVCVTCHLEFYINCHATFHHAAFLHSVNSLVYGTLVKLGWMRQRCHYHHTNAECADPLSIFSLPFLTSRSIPRLPDD